MNEIKQRKFIFGIGNSLLILITISLLILSLLTQPAYSFFCIVFLISWIPVALFWYHHWIKLVYKEKVVQPILKEIHKNIKYSYTIEYELGYRKLIQDYKLIPFAKRFDFNDEIQDKIDDINYVSFDCTASHLLRGRKQSIIDFKGKVYDITLGETYCDYILKEAGERLEIQGFEKLDLESIEMNQKFDLYTNDLVAIHKIFTPTRIKKCNDLEFLHDGRSFVCHLGTHFYIFLANEDNQFESLNDKDEIIKAYERQYQNLRKYLEYFL